MYNEQVSKEVLDKSFELAKSLLSVYSYEENVKLAERFNNNSFKVVAIFNNVFKDGTRDESILLNNGVPESLVRVIRTLNQNLITSDTTQAESFYDYTLRINFCKSRMVKLIFIHMMKQKREQITNSNTTDKDIQLYAFAEFLVKNSYNITEKRLKQQID